jgi:hypothetical protein
MEDLGMRISFWLEKATTAGRVDAARRPGDPMKLTSNGAQGSAG